MAKAALRRETCEACQASQELKRIESDGLYFRARGCVWRRVRSEGAFWVCDLVKEGTSYTDRAERVAMLPNIEDIEAIDTVIFDKPSYREESASGHAPTADTLLLAKTMTPEADPTQPNLIGAGHQVAANAAVEFKDWQYEPLSRVLSQPFPRLLIADDVGLGKTTEAGLVLSHLAQTGRAERVLIIAPAHLCAKWQSEMQSRFGLYFELFDRATRHRLTKRGVRNPWAAHERVIVSQDFAKRYENLKPLRRTEWDVVVIDECHHYIHAANGMASRLRQLAEEICLQSPGLLLLSATPYRGGPEEYDSLLNLVDPLCSERDEDGHLTADAEALRKQVVVRRLKRDLPESSDFPERSLKNIRADEQMEPLETKLVQGAAQVLGILKAQEKSAIHLTAEILQKRVSSSWHAFEKTLRAIRERDASLDVPELSEFLTQVAAFNKNPASHAKFKSLSDFVQKNVLSKGNKLVVFTEYVDTLDFLFDELGRAFPKLSFASISGSEVRARFKGKQLSGSDGVSRADIEAEFSNEESPLQILLCTDACSEGVDFQKACHQLMHYELPWSLVRMEQRNGRIDRFGQKHPPCIYNLVYETDATPDQRILSKIATRLDEARREFGSVSDLIEQAETRGVELASACMGLGDFDLGRQPENPAELGERRPATEALFELSQELFEEQWTFHHVALSYVLEREAGAASLQPLKKFPGVYSLSLPEASATTGADAWDLRGLERTYGYPSKNAAWNVIFDPKAAYEHSQRLAGLNEGEGGRLSEFHFLSAFHPIMEVALRKYKTFVHQEGAPPVLTCDELESDCALIFEWSLGSAGERGTTICRKVDSITSDGMRSAVLNSGMGQSDHVSQLEALRKGANLGSRLPKDSVWDALVEQALHFAKNEAQNVQQNLKLELERLQHESTSMRRLAEDERSAHRRKFKEHFVEARDTWIRELRLPALTPETKEPLVRIQPLALVIQKPQTVGSAHKRSGGKK